MRDAPGFRHALPSQLARFVAVGAIGFLADALAYGFFAHVLDWAAVPARLAAFLPATLLTWVINRRWAFVRDDEDAARGPLLQYAHYLAVQGAGIAVSFTIFNTLLARHPAHDFLALACGSVAAMALNFAGSRWLVFTGRAQDGSLLAVAGMGGLSVMLGQDNNWDMHNYHLYNAYAFVTGRLHTDLAPAGMQTYFNPLVDLPYYWMTLHLPAPTVAFVMGAVHGLALVALAGSVRLALPQAGSRTVWLLALAGCAGPTFLSEIGNTMGDNTTAPFVLAALLVCLQCFAAGTSGRAALWRFAGAGLLVGLATGLKLTNAVYAVALAAAVAAAAAPWLVRAQRVGALSLGGIAGLAASAGFWFWRMAVEFGNPLFPQFNNIFHSPMAAAMGMGDTRWGPRSVLEAIGYPFVLLRDPLRFGETPYITLVWSVAYVAAIAALLAIALRRRGSVPPLSQPTRGLLVFVGTSYLVWLTVFAIGRYAVDVEVLLPLVTWVLAREVVFARRWSSWARRSVVAALALSVAVSVLPFRTWGHGAFAAKAYDVPMPPIANPATASIVFIGQPTAWMAVFLPPEMAFVSMFNFPESPAYIARVDEILRSRGGEVGVVLTAASDTQANNLRRFNEWSTRVGLPADGIACAAVKWATHFSPRYSRYPAASGGACVFVMPADLARDVQDEDRAGAARWAGHLRERGWKLDVGSCQRLEAAMGEARQPYQFCKLAR